MGRPVIQSYGPADYGSTSFNWSVTSDSNGHIYVGNEEILEFDGKRWTQIDVGGSHLIRGLAVDEHDRVWVGAATDFGYLERLPTGERVFKSLKPLLTPGQKLGEVWAVYCLNGYTVFVATSKVAAWDGKTLTIREFPGFSTRILSFRLHGKIFVNTMDGSWLFDGASYTPYPVPGLEHKAIIWGTETSNGDVLLGADNGVMRVSGGKGVVVPCEATSFLQTALATAAVRLKDGTTCIGTIFGGLLFINERGEAVRLLDRQLGLPSQNVMSLHLDANGNLWIPTTRSVLRMDGSPTASLFDGVNGLAAGISLRLLRSPTMGLLSLSEESVVQLSPARKWNERASFARLKGLERMYWDGALAEDGTVVLAGFQKLDLLTKEKIYELDSEKVDLTRVYGAPGRQGQLWALNKQELVALSYQKNTYTFGPPLIQFDEAPRDSMMDPDQVIWVSTVQHGIYAISTVSEEVPAIRHFERGVELPDTLKKGRLFRIGRRLYSYEGNTVIQLNRSRFETEKTLANWNLTIVEQAGENDVLAIGNETDAPSRLLRLEASGDRLSATPLDCADIRAVGKPLSIERPDSTGTVWIAGSEGMLRVTPEGLRKFSPPAAPVFSLVTWSTGDGKVNLPLNTQPVLTFADNSVLTLEVRDPLRPLEKDIVIETRLRAPNQTWQRCQGTIVFQELHEGNYVVEARILNVSDTPSKTAAYFVTIKPPWQRSLAAYIVYGILGVGFLWGLFTLRLRQIATRNAQLERLVDERTDELTRATAAKSAFLANMGHEILNPLNGVVGLVENLKGTGLRPEQEPMVAQLGNCTSQLVSVVEDVLEYSRIEAGTVTVRLRAFQVGEPVNAAVDIFRAVQHRGAAEIVIHSEPGVLEKSVFGAPDRVRQILVNYVSNAMKFGQGTPITLSVLKEGDERWVFRVTDQGPGIPASEQAGLFHRFHRAKAARRSEIPGTGLGLAACKAYAEAMGGEVGLESTEGKGATFFLRVPMRAATPSDSVATVVTTDNLTGKRVLVLDDHGFNRQVLSDLLGRMGAQASSAENIPEAKTLFAEKPYDLVFADLDLGETSGLEFVDWIRHRAPSGRDVPVIATTAFAMDEVRAKCEEAGMDGFVAKPVSAWKIREAVARIEHVRAGPSPAIATGPAEARENGSFIDLLAGGRPGAAEALRRKAWVEIRSETAAATWASRRGNWAETAKFGHRLTSVAILLGRPELVALSKALHAQAKNEQRSEALETRRQLATLLRAEKSASRLSEKRPEPLRNEPPDAPVG